MWFSRLQPVNNVQLSLFVEFDFITSVKPSVKKALRKTQVHRTDESGSPIHKCFFCTTDCQWVHKKPGKSKLTLARYSSIPTPNSAY